MSLLARYTLFSEPMEGEDYVQLRFERLFQNEEMPSAYPIWKSKLRAKDAKKALHPCIDFIKHKKSFFISQKEMQSIENDFLTQKYFTLGLISVKENEEHYIINTELDSTSPPIIALYLCKDNKRDVYKPYSGSYIALVNEARISQDFVPYDLDKTEGTIVTVQSNSVYFFYTASSGCFKIEVKRRNPITSEDGPSPKRIKEEKKCTEVSTENPFSLTSNANSNEIFSPHTSHSIERERLPNVSEPQVEINYNRVNLNSVEDEKLKEELKSVKQENQKLRDKIRNAATAAKLIFDILKDDNL